MKITLFPYNYINFQNFSMNWRINEIPQLNFTTAVSSDSNGQKYYLINITRETEIYFDITENANTLFNLYVTKHQILSYNVNWNYVLNVNLSFADWLCRLGYKPKKNTISQTLCNKTLGEINAYLNSITGGAIPVLFPISSPYVFLRYDFEDVSLLDFLNELVNLGWCWYIDVETNQLKIHPYFNQYSNIENNPDFAGTINLNEFSDFQINYTPPKATSLTIIREAYPSEIPDQIVILPEDFGKCIELPIPVKPSQIEIVSGMYSSPRSVLLVTSKKEQVNIGGIDTILEREYFYAFRDYQLEVIMDFCGQGAAVAVAGYCTSGVQHNYSTNCNSLNIGCGYCDSSNNGLAPYDARNPSLCYDKIIVIEWGPNYSSDPVVIRFKKWDLTLGDCIEPDFNKRTCFTTEAKELVKNYSTPNTIYYTLCTVPNPEIRISNINDQLFEFAANYLARINLATRVEITGNIWKKDFLPKTGKYYKIVDTVTNKHIYALCESVEINITDKEKNWRATFVNYV